MIEVKYISYIFISGGFGVLYNLPSVEPHLNIQYVEKVIFLISAAASIDRFVRLISRMGNVPPVRTPYLKLGHLSVKLILNQQISTARNLVLHHCI